MDENDVLNNTLWDERSSTGKKDGITRDRRKKVDHFRTKILERMRCLSANCTRVFFIRL